MNQISTNIKRLRKARGWSQDVLGVRAGYTNGTMIYQIERGLKEPSRQKLAEIARALEVSVAELTGEVGPCQSIRYHADGDHQTVSQHVERLMPDELTALVQRVVHAEFEAYLEKMKTLLKEALTARRPEGLWMQGKVHGDERPPPESG